MNEKIVLSRGRKLNTEVSLWQARERLNSIKSRVDFLRKNAQNIQSLEAQRVSLIENRKRLEEEITKIEESKLKSAEKIRDLKTGINSLGKEIMEINTKLVEEIKAEIRYSIEKIIDKTAKYLTQKSSKIEKLKSDFSQTHQISAEIIDLFFLEKNAEYQKDQEYLNKLKSDIAECKFELWSHYPENYNLITMLKGLEKYLTLRKLSLEESCKKAGENLNDESLKQVKFFDLESKLFGFYSAKIEKIILALSDNEPIKYLLDAELSEYELRLLGLSEQLFIVQQKLASVESSYNEDYVAQVSELASNGCDEVMKDFLEQKQLVTENIQTLSGMVDEELRINDEDSALQDLFRSNQEEVGYHEHYIVTSYAPDYDQ
jgi:hypothetical protein